MGRFAVPQPDSLFQPPLGCSKDGSAFPTGKSPAALQCYPSELSQAAKILECGGRAQRRHRFGTLTNAVKAAWRFASRRTPKSLVAASTALRLCD